MIEIVEKPQRGDGAPGWEEFEKRVLGGESLSTEDWVRLERVLIRRHQDRLWFRALADRLIEGFDHE